MYTSQDILYRSILIASFIIGTIIVGFLLLIIRQQRKFRERNLRNVQTEISTLERERKKIAAELHDGLGALLSLHKLDLESIVVPSSQAQMKLRQSITLADEIIERTRRISEGLIPATLLHYGIVYAMEEFINTINDHSPIEIIFEHESIPEIPSVYSTHVFRMLQEIIHNTLKHSGADTMKIKLWVDQHNLLILTADNGTGFSTNDADENKGLGLRNLKNRTNLLNGTLNRISRAGEGTRYRICLPLPC